MERLRQVGMVSQLRRLSSCGSWRPDTYENPKTKLSMRWEPNAGTGSARQVRN